MTKSAFVFVLLLILAAGLGAQEWKTTTVEDMTLNWAVEGENLRIKVAAPTSGWVAVGFEPSAMMADANILIGYVSGNEVVVEDHFGNSRFTHQPDGSLGGTANVTVLSGSESGGKTELEFTIPLDSGDEYDKVLSAGQSVKVILAWGTNDNVGRKHRSRYSTQITL